MISHEKVAGEKVHMNVLWYDRGDYSLYGTTSPIRLSMALLGRTGFLCKPSNMKKALVC